MHNYTSDVAFQGHAGLELAKQRFEQAMNRKAPMYQIIIIEFSMQDMDGCQVTQAIHQLFDFAIDLADNDAERAIVPTLPYICCVTAYTEA